MIPKLPSVSSRLAPGKKVASVALLLRETPSATLDVFFILRQVNKRDSWSGHVGFPGGRANAGETPLQACYREVMEEVGLDVAKSSVLLGRLPSIYPGNLEVICYVFALNQGYAWNPVLQESEICACGWAPLTDLLCPKPVPFVVDLAQNPIIRLSFWAPYLGLSRVVYTAVFLNITDRVPACSSPIQVPTKLPMSYRDSANVIAESGAFMLWGLTLQLCNRFLIQSGLGEPVVLRGIFGVPKMFALDVHNVMSAPLRGHLRHWSQVLWWYQTALLGLASAFLIGGSALVKCRLMTRSRI